MCQPMCWPQNHCPAVFLRFASTLRAYQLAASRVRAIGRKHVMLNVCMLGHGMMGTWHSQALQAVQDCQLHTVVGRPVDPAAEKPSGAAGLKPSSTAEFAAEYGYKKWTTSLDEALADPEVDIVMIAGPTET